MTLWLTSLNTISDQNGDASEKDSLIAPSRSSQVRKGDDLIIIIQPLILSEVGCKRICLYFKSLERREISIICYGNSSTAVSGIQP